jgi:poly-gamma-glutamate capsule biosynthesis protein CapA/YwtB (metallophosphatase superfamily)
MRVVATGDSLFSGGNLRAKVDKRVLDVLASGDAAFTNIEFSCPAKGLPPTPKRFITSTGPGALDELLSLGLNLFSAANNQMGDFGHPGVVTTLEEMERRKMAFAGLGRSLSEARAARFLETKAGGRVGLVAATTTRAALYAASNAGMGIVPRAGVNPLRWGRTYVLPDREFRQMQRIDEMLGIARSRDEMRWIEAQPPLPEGVLQFGSLFEGYIPIERGDEAEVRYHASEKDVAAILADIEDARHRADIVIMSLHAHEGTAENWYSAELAAFIRDFAIRAIDAGAAAVFGHGPHYLRGIEFHKGRPIFYSLGSLLFEFEMGEQLNTPEGYTAFDLPEDSRPSALHVLRRRDPEGRPWGFYGDPRFSRSVIAVCDFEPGRTRVDLVPIDLDLNRERAVERGIPRRATGKVARAICDEVAALSRPYGTAARYDAKRMTLAVRPA